MERKTAIVFGIGQRLYLRSPHVNLRNHGKLLGNMYFKTGNIDISLSQHVDAPY